MKNYKIVTSFDSPEGMTARTYKTGVNFMIFDFNIRGKLSVKIKLCVIFSMTEYQL